MRKYFILVLATIVAVSIIFGISCSAPRKQSQPPTDRGNQIETTEARLKSIEKRVTVLEGWLNHVATDQVDTLNRRVEKLEKQVGATFEFTSIETRLSKLERQVGSSFGLSSLSSIESRLSNLERQVGSQYGLLGIEGRLSELERRIQRLEWQ